MCINKLSEITELVITAGPYLALGLHGSGAQPQHGTEALCWSLYSKHRDFLRASELAGGLSAKSLLMPPLYPGVGDNLAKLENQ